MKQKAYSQQVAAAKKSANGPAKGIVAVEPFPVPEKPILLEGIRAKVFSDRYSWKDEVGNSIEKYPEQMWGRVAKAISSVEKTPQLRKMWQEKFYNALSGFKFLPGGRILSGAGTGYEVTFYNCFVIPSPNDSRGGIIDNLKMMIEIMSRAGGVGINLSSLRPRGARVYKVNGTSSGPVNWANLYSVGTHDVIQQGGCFSADTLIMTHLGLIPISELIRKKIHLYVSTHQGYKKVIAKFDNGIKKVYQVKTNAGYTLKITSEHKLLTADKNGHFYLKKLSKFKVGDPLTMLLGEWRQDIPYVSLNTYLHSPSKFSYGRIKVDLPKILDEMVAFLIGIYDADGSKIKDEYSPNGKGIRIAVDQKRQLDLQKLVSIIKQVFGVEPVIKQGDGAVYNVCVYSREINEFLVLNGLLKEYSINVEVPSLIFSSPRSVVEAYLAGVFMGDGGNRGGKGGFRLSTVSYNYASQLQLLLLNLGIASKMNIQKRAPKNWRTMYTVTINGHRFMKRFYEIIIPYTQKANDQVFSKRDGTFNWPFNLTEKYIYLSGFQCTIARTNIHTSQKAVQFLAGRMSFIEESDRDDVAILASCVSDRITSIEYVGQENVYDLEVEDVHLLSGNGFYTSNSRRGALMLMLNDWHPDVEEFIEIKKDLSRINGANLSVCVSDGFMEAVEKDLDWTLRFPDTKFPGYDELWDGDILQWEDKGYPVKVYKVIKAKEIWEKICQAAWASAEPGLHFLERSNKQSNTWYFEKLISTNPCVTGDTLISTAEGLIPMKEVVESHFEGGKRFGGNMSLIIDERALDPKSHGITMGKAIKFFDVGVRDVLKLTTKSGFELVATPDHRVLTPTGWTELQNLREGDQVMIQSGRGQFGITDGLTFDIDDENLPKRWNKNLGQVLGWLIGDGWIRTGDENCRVGWTFGEDDKATLESFRKIINDWYGRDIKAVKRVRNTYHLSYHGRRLVDFFLKLGVKPVKADEKEVPQSIYTAPKEAVIGFLQGLFTSDGTVRDSRKSNSDWVALTSKSKKLLQGVQLILLNLRIKSRLFNRSRKARVGMFPYRTKDGQLHTYTTDGILYELGIFGDFRELFKNEIGFINLQKQKRLENTRLRFKKRLQDPFLDKVVSVTKWGKEKVYDVTEVYSHSVIANGLIVHQCGEQPLGAWAVCNLGALNLSAFVENEEMNYDKLAEYAKIATRFLDNVVDANFYFYEENEKQQKGIRRTGLGTMGLGDALIKMKVRYGSDQSLEVIEKIYKTVRDASYEASADLASEKGPFSRFDKEKYLQSYFIKQLPDYIKEKIAHSGIRNAVVLTQAPTGTTSLLAGVSSGIEPVYDFVMVRRDRIGEHVIYHPLYKQWQEANPGADKVPDYFVSANDLTPDDHVKVQAMIQKYTDSSISKTVNAPNSHTVEQVRQLYMKAYKLGCKGVTYMRDGSREGTLSHADEKPQTSEQPVMLPQPSHRSAVLNGRTYKMLTPVGEAFITINRDKMNQPMEVFAIIGKAGMQTGADAEAIGRLISLALRIADGNRMEVAKKIISQLRGIGGSSQVGFGKNRVMSLGDAIAQVLAEEISQAATANSQALPLEVEPVVYHNSQQQQLDIPDVQPVSMVSGGDLCPECGESTFVLEEGCSKCYSCGFSLC